MKISFTQLKELSAKVAEKEKCIDDLIDSLNEQLAALNFNIPVWLMDDPLSDGCYEQETREDGSLRRYREGNLFGYDKVGCEFQLVTREIELEIDADEEQTKWRIVTKPWQLPNHSWDESEFERQAILLIPKLIQSMTERAENYLEIVEQIEAFVQKPKSSNSQDVSS